MRHTKRVQRVDSAHFEILEEKTLLSAQILSTQGDSATTGGNNHSYLQGMSEDGRYAIYITNANNVNSSVTDGNGSADLYLVDRVTGTETLISRSSSSATTTANGNVVAAYISADGNFIAYESTSTNVVADQSNQLLVSNNIFMYNRQTGATVLVSSTSGSSTTSANGNSSFGDTKNPISVDGKYLFYQTYATDVNSGVLDLNSKRDLYRFNRVTGMSELVSHAAGSLTQTELLSGVIAAAVSDDGTKAVFTRDALYYCPVIAWNGVDGSQRTVTNVGISGVLAISGDGRWLAYGVTGTTVNGAYVTSFAGTFTRRLSNSDQLNSIAMSYDGRYIAFLSLGSVDIPGATYLSNSFGYHAFVHDRLGGVNGTTSIVSHQYGNELTAIDGVIEISISPSGRYIYFDNYNQNLVSDPVPSRLNLYRYDVLTRKNFLMSVANGTTSAADGESRLKAYSRSFRSDLTGDYFGFSSTASNLTSPGDLNTSYFDAVIATGGIGDKVGTWSNGRFLVDVDDNRTRDLWRDVSGAYGGTTDIPISGNWNYADGLQNDEIGTFKDGVWYLDNNGNSSWDQVSGGDLQVTFGATGDIPVIGDWNGDGKDEIGIFRNGTWMFDTNGNYQWDGAGGGDSQISFGIAGDIPIVGDWNGDGIDDIGVVRNGNWYLDLNGNRTWDSGIDGVYSFGNATGDVPIVGDWDRDGKDDIGVFRSGTWYLDMNGSRTWNTGIDYCFVFGNATDLPMVGKWKNTRIGQVVPSSDLVDDVGKWNNALFSRDADLNHVAGTAGDTANSFGNSTDVPLIGDWDGNGYDEIGVYRNSASPQWYLDYNGSLTYNAAPAGDLLKTFGTSGDIPLVGNWNGGGKDEVGTFRISNGSGVWSLDASGNFQWDQASGGDLQAVFGVAGDTPVVGDWDGDGKDNIGIFRIDNGQGVWYLDYNGNRMWDGVTGGDVYAVFGATGDQPVIGDWNGDGRDDIGTFNAGVWTLDLNGNYVWNGTANGDSQFTYGASGDKPLVGNWKPSGLVAGASLPPLSASVTSSSVSSSLETVSTQLAVETSTHGRKGGRGSQKIAANQLSTGSAKKLARKAGKGNSDEQTSSSLNDAVFSDWNFIV